MKKLRVYGAETLRIWFPSVGSHKMFQFSDMHYDYRFLDAFRGQSVRARVHQGSVVQKSVSLTPSN